MDEKQADDGSTECEQAQKIPQRRAWEIHEQLRYGWPGARITIDLGDGDCCSS